VTASDPTAALLAVRDLSVAFPTLAGRKLHALRDVSIDLGAGEILGVVGESGCGKSTLGRSIVGLQRPSAGEILWQGAPIASLGGPLARSRLVQMIFQDPYSSLNPVMSVADTLAEVLRVHGFSGGRDALRGAVERLMATVGLPAGLADRRPHALSGGQRQRVSIARALAPSPRLIVADEAVSALDVSVQAQIVNLFGELRRDLGLSLMFISHDLDVVRHIGDRVAVMYLGEVVEVGPTEAVFERPRHPYTRGLVAAIPRPDPRHRSRTAALEGELPDPTALPDGCAFVSRCPFARSQCREGRPLLAATAPDHRVRCFRTDDLPTP
jgi:oligopeptide transport system ATP-binding protein